MIGAEAVQEAEEESGSDEKHFRVIVSVAGSRFAGSRFEAGDTQRQQAQVQVTGCL
jgi:hypothetical protein